LESLKENIINTAAKMFEEYGLRSVSIGDICNKMQISKKTFYTVFQQKEELIETILAYQHEAIISRMRDMTSNTNAIEALIVLLKAVRKHINETTPAIVFDLKKYYPALLKKFENHHKESMQRGVINNLQKGIEENYYKSNLNIELTAMFFSIQIPNIFQTLEDSKKYSKKQLFDFFIDLLLSLIVSEKGKQYIAENYNN
jgi:AcrR family transcriptional regulator